MVFCCTVLQQPVFRIDALGQPCHHGVAFDTFDRFVGQQWQPPQLRPQEDHVVPEDRQPHVFIELHTISRCVMDVDQFRKPKQQPMDGFGGFVTGVPGLLRREVFPQQGWFELDRDGLWVDGLGLFPQGLPQDVEGHLAFVELPLGLPVVGLQLQDGFKTRLGFHGLVGLQQAAAFAVVSFGPPRVQHDATFGVREGLVVLLLAAVHQGTVGVTLFEAVECGRRCGGCSVVPRSASSVFFVYVVCRNNNLCVSVNGIFKGAVAVMLVAALFHGIDDKVQILFVHVVEQVRGQVACLEGSLEGCLEGCLEGSRFASAILVEATTVILVEATSFVICRSFLRGGRGRDWYWLHPGLYRQGFHQYSV